MRSQQRGSIFILSAGIMIALTVFAVLAIDVGRVFVVRNELQNVADSAALAGANCLTRVSTAGSATQCDTTMGTSLNWTRASANAEAQLALNSASNFPISSTDSGHQIEVGYWNLCPPAAACPPGRTGVPSGGAFSTAFNPVTAFDKPAVRVLVRKAVGVNNGPIAMLTQLMFNVGAGVPMTAEAVAVISSPSSVAPGGLVPQAINKCMFDRFWDSTTNSPKLADQSTLTYWDGKKTSTIPQTIGEPWRIRIGSAYKYEACDAGQWTTFNLPDANDVPTVRQLINNGNGTTLEINKPTYIQPGAEAALYDTLDAKYPTPPGADVTMVVVDSTDLSNKGWANVFSFAGFHITDIQKAPEKYIEGNFILNTISGGGGIGPFLYSYTPPRLAQ